MLKYARRRQSTGTHSTLVIGRKLWNKFKKNSRKFEKGWEKYKKQILIETRNCAFEGLNIIKAKIFRYKWKISHW